MRLTIGQLRKMITEALGPDMTLLSKVASRRPYPDAALSPEEASAVRDLKARGLVAWDLGSRGWTPTAAGLDALGRR